MKSKGDTQGRQVSIHCKLALSEARVTLMCWLGVFPTKTGRGKRELAATIREARQRDHSGVSSYGTASPSTSVSKINNLILSF